MTIVIFRKRKNGDVIALFPEIPADPYERFCLSYEHIGQHGAADYAFVISKTKRASFDEYAPLQAELEKIGYSLQVRLKRLPMYAKEKERRTRIRNTANEAAKTDAEPVTPLNPF